jgi:hypothetical protein
MAKAKRQVDKFKEAARDLETDDNEKRFNEKLGKIARQKPGALLATRKWPKKQTEPNSVGRPQRDLAVVAPASSAQDQSSCADWWQRVGCTEGVRC